MLLQTIKSRNLWLWSEIIGTHRDTDALTNLKANLSRLEERRDEIQNELRLGADSNSWDNLDNQTAWNIETKPVLEEELSDLCAQIKNLEEQLAKKNQNKINENFSYYHRYTAPFKITALQSVDVTWDNPVGESYGITANFLQSWHNKPVNITFKGISYMGAFGGNTVGNLTNSEADTNKLGSEITQASDVNGLNHIANNISAGFTSVAHSISKYTNSNLTGIKSDASVDGKYDVVIDQDVEKINNLLSNYGEGLYPQKNKSGSPYIYLLMENPGSGTNNSEHGGFVTFIGHIKNFTYSERVDKPFLYDYTVQFVGEPTLQNAIRGATIEAQQDASSVKLTVVTSDSGYSLGYGW